MASTYRQVGFGSTGSAVSKLQTILTYYLSKLLKRKLK